MHSIVSTRISCMSSIYDYMHTRHRFLLRENHSLQDFWNMTMRLWSITSNVPVTFTSILFMLFCCVEVLPHFTYNFTVPFERDLELKRHWFALKGSNLSSLPPTHTPLPAFQRATQGPFSPSEGLHSAPWQLVTSWPPSRQPISSD